MFEAEGAVVAVSVEEEAEIVLLGAEFESYWQEAIIYCLTKCGTRYECAATGSESGQRLEVHGGIPTGAALRRCLARGRAAARWWAENTGLDPPPELAR